MIDKQFVQKVLRSALRRSHGLKDHNLMHPTREWFMGLGAGLVFLLSGTAWCVYLYWGYNTVEPETAAEIDAPVNIYQKATVEAALTELSARAARHEEFKGALEASKRPTPITEEVTGDVEPLEPLTASSTPPSPPIAEPEPGAGLPEAL